MSWQGSTRRKRLPQGWNQIRLMVLERDGHRCQLHYPGCTLIATECDHRQHGDNHQPNNLQAACHECHARKTIAERTVRTERRPAEHHPGLR